MLRLTADEMPFSNVSGGSLATATARYFLRGQNFVWVGINGNPIRSGSDPDDQVNRILNFDKNTADIDLRTCTTATLQIRTKITAQRVLVGGSVRLTINGRHVDDSVQGQAVWSPQCRTIRTNRTGPASTSFAMIDCRSTSGLRPCGGRSVAERSYQPRR